MSVLVLYYKVAPEKISSAQLSALIHRWRDELPANKQQKISQLHQQSDQLLSLAGLQLVKKGISELLKRPFSLQQLQFPAQEKPFISVEQEENIDFNISHSGNVVCCVISDKLKVGIDIELRRQISEATLKKFLADQPDSIKGNDTKELSEFFNIWTKSEAIIKAANYGSIFNMKELKLEENGGFYQNHYWHTSPINISTDDPDKEYTCHIACSKKMTGNDISIKQITNL